MSGSGTAKSAWATFGITLPNRFPYRTMQILQRPCRRNQGRRPRIFLTKSCHRNKLIDAIESHWRRPQRRCRAMPTQQTLIHFRAACRNADSAPSDRCSSLDRAWQVNKQIAATNGERPSARLKPHRHQVMEKRRKCAAWPDCSIASGSVMLDSGRGFSRVNILYKGTYEKFLCF